VSDVFEELKTPSASHKAELKRDELVIGPADSNDASLGAFQLVAKKALLAEGEGQIEIVTSHRNSDLPGMPYDQLTVRRQQWVGSQPSQPSSHLGVPTSAQESPRCTHDG
jgi:hypothetical protein